MTRVNIRTFAKNPSKYLNSLPIVLTKYRRDYATVTPIDRNIRTNEVSENTEKTLSEEKIKNCAYPGCSNPGYREHSVTRNGKPDIATLCKYHYDLAEEREN